MAYFHVTFDPDAEAEMRGLLANPQTDVDAAVLLQRIGFAGSGGLENREFPVDFCTDWSGLYVRRYKRMTAVFKILGPAKPGSTMHVLSVNTNPGQAMADAKKRC